MFTFLNKYFKNQNFVKTTIFGDYFEFSFYLIKSIEAFAEITFYNNEVLKKSSNSIKTKHLHLGINYKDLIILKLSENTFNKIKKLFAIK